MTAMAVGRGKQRTGLCFDGNPRIKPEYALFYFATPEQRPKAEQCPTPPSDRQVPWVMRGLMRGLPDKTCSVNDSTFL